jgi:glycosyltransferase involved in cell wall biosynthesis
LVPDGFDHLRRGRAGRRPTIDRRDGAVVFVANFAYQPNVDAALYLGETIWPLIHREVADAQLWLVGNEPPLEVEALAAGSDGVKVTGRVADVTPYMEEAKVVVCPLRIGGGVKVKVLEALYLGKAIVTTTVGAQGIPDPNSAMWVVDEPSGFAQAAIELLRASSKRTDLERRARMAAYQLPTWDESARALESCYGELLGSQRSLLGPPD